MGVFQSPLYYFLGVSFGKFAAFVLLGMVIVLLTEEIMDFIFRDKIKNFKSYNKGAKGEYSIDKFLKLIDGIINIPDVVLPTPEERANIDNIVIYKNGIFAIETKNFSGNYVCDKDRWYKIKEGHIWNFSNTDKLDKNPSGQAKVNALKIKEFINNKLPELKIKWVQAIAVFLDINSNLYILQEPDNCKIVRNGEELILYLKNYKLPMINNLSNENIKKLEGFLSRYSKKK